MHKQHVAFSHPGVYLNALLTISGGNDRCIIVVNLKNPFPVQNLNLISTGLFANLKRLGEAKPYMDWAFCKTKKTGESKMPSSPPNLAILSQMMMKVGKDILWVEIIAN